MALAPISVPLPPRQAPKDNAHQSGSRLVIPIAPISLIIGISVATKGMLSINAEAIALSHKISIVEAVTFPDVIFIASAAIALITPVSTKPPTKINKPTKKKIASHSKRLKILAILFSRLLIVININKDAPAKATVADSKPS